jgi:hypothetical protein
MLDAVEAQLTGSAMTPQSNWIWVNSKRNLDLLSFVDFLGDFDSSLSLLYDDDLQQTSTLEQFPGHLPNSGDRIGEFPETGFIGLVVSLFLFDAIEGDPAGFATQLRTLPEMEVRWM